MYDVIDKIQKRAGKMIFKYDKKKQKKNVNGSERRLKEGKK